MVLEVSSYQLEDSTFFRPKVACLLNITPDHLDHHGGMEKYVKAKYLVAREREIVSNDQHTVKVNVYTPNGCVAANETTFFVKERIGGGDAFTAGFLHGLLNVDTGIKDILDFAITCFVLKHTIGGDVLPMSAAEISSYTIFSTKDVVR